jgi:hypothetical protein
MQTGGQRHSRASECCGVGLEVMMKKYMSPAETKGPWSSPQSLLFIQTEIQIHSWFTIMKFNKLANNFWQCWNLTLAPCLHVVKRDLQDRTRYALIAISLLLYPNSLWIKCSTFFFFNSCQSYPIKTFIVDLKFMGPCIVSMFQYISNKMQRYTVYLYLKTALHV